MPDCTTFHARGRPASTAASASAMSSPTLASSPASAGRPPLPKSSRALRLAPGAICTMALRLSLATPSLTSWPSISTSPLTEASKTSEKLRLGGMFPTLTGTETSAVWVPRLRCRLISSAGTVMPVLWTVTETTLLPARQPASATQAKRTQRAALTGSSRCSEAGPGSGHHRSAPAPARCPLRPLPRPRHRRPPTATAACRAGAPPACGRRAAG